MESWGVAETKAHFSEVIDCASQGEPQQITRNGSLMAKSRRACFSPGVMDTLIAATALANGMLIATRNRKDFERLGVEF